MINIVVTSKPVDGLLYYSYEYVSVLNELGITAKLVVICHRNFTQQDYIRTITAKYIHCKNIVFDTFVPNKNDVTLVMGRSMITLSWQNFKDYKIEQQDSLMQLFSNKVIAVYSENHPVDYPKAVNFYSTKKIIDICDTEIYPNGVGEHFEKTINFGIYKLNTNNIQFKHLFLGTNNNYYASIEKVIDKFLDHGILTYNESYVNIKYNNIFVPVENLMGMFETYVYTKETFDPAPRLIQECKYFGKEVIYLRDKTIKDGGSVYWKRDIEQPDVTAIREAYDKLH